MSSLPVILIFDIGKTNKKVLLFNEQYEVVYETSTQLDETTDEDGFACEDVEVLTCWITQTFEELKNDARFTIRAINFSAYGASFVYLNDAGEVIAPLYNYLKPYSPALQQQFYNTYGGESEMSAATASPVLGNLNAGMQLYRMKYEKPDLFAAIQYALHLPQYLSFIFTRKVYTDITSIGCHTGLWNFAEQHYHQWVTQEGIDKKFAYILPSSELAGYTSDTIPVGGGLHDSSAALIPYLKVFKEPFLLLSTGTWCISLNPFNHVALSIDELQNDCLCYLSFQGKPVKASRLFAGYEHEQQTKRLAAHFKKSFNYYNGVKFDANLIKQQDLNTDYSKGDTSEAMVQQSAFAKRSLEVFSSYEEAYHQLMADIMVQQVFSIQLVLNGTEVKQIFVDGGFSRNPIFMNMLAGSFPQLEIVAASVAQASALGAALVMHDHWNSKPLPAGSIALKYYTAMQE